MMNFVLQLQAEVSQPRQHTHVKCYSTSFLAGYGQFSVSLSMHTSQEFNSSITNYPAVVTLGKRVYFEAKVGSNDTDITALLEKCSVSPTTDMNHPSSYILIQQRFEFIYIYKYIYIYIYIYI